MATLRAADLSQDVWAVFKRFPVACFMAALLAIFFLLEIHANIEEARSYGLISGAMLGGYVSIILQTLGEGRGRAVPLWAQALAALAALALCALYDVLGFLPWAAILAAVLYLGSAPFFRRGKDNIRVWDYTHRLWIAVIFAVAGSVLFLLGMLFIAQALKLLFNIKVDDIVFKWVIPIAFAFLAPLYWMSSLTDPRNDGEESLRDPSFIARAVGFLSVWLISPMVLVFALILLAYGAQIAIKGEIPNGETAMLVVPFLIIGTLNWLILDPPFLREKRLAAVYRKVWFYAMIPAALLLAAAVFIRITSYGLTEQRYMLMLCVVWALGTAFWFLFRRDQRDLRLIPGFAALLLAVASIGPWGAHSTSLMAQKARVKSVLAQASVLDEQGFLKAKDQLPALTDAQIHKLRGLSYIAKAGDRDWVMRYFAPSDALHEKLKSDRPRNRYSYYEIEERLPALSTDGAKGRQYFDLALDPKLGGFSLDGYSAMSGVMNGAWGETELVLGDMALSVSRQRDNASGEIILKSANGAQGIFDPREALADIVAASGEVRRTLPFTVFPITLSDGTQLGIAIVSGSSYADTNNGQDTQNYNFEFILLAR